MDFKTPVNITISNTSEEVVSFRYFKVNMVQKLEASEFVKITVTNSDELGYYMDLINEVIGLSVIQEETDNNEENTKEEPTEPTEPTEPEE